MFIYSMRASTLKFFGAVFLSLALFLALFALTAPVDAAGGEDTEVVNYGGIRTEEERIAFLESFGWRVKPSDKEITEFLLPKEFDRILSSYNEIQKEQGLDLSRYAKKTVTRYTYVVKNYPDYDGRVLVNLIIHRDRVVACDICSADSAGFVEGLRLPK